MRLWGFSALAALSALACLVGRANADLKGVFAHYMVGSMGSSDEAVKDVQDAKAMGLDAFALNVQDVSSGWSTSAIQMLFDAAATNDFKLFFSFDMAVLDQPSTFLPLFRQYQSNPAYYYHDNRPFVSTFDGGAKSFGASSPNAGWQSQFKDALASSGINPFFVPDFDDYGGATYDDAFFSNYPVVDGVFSWEAAWPQESEGIANVSSAKDQVAIQASHATGKVYMMPLSSLQFKHIDGGQNWYRRGELNLPQRIGQVLEVQPDFVEIITWNDSGESHYIGNCWPEAIAGAPAIQAYSNGFDHTAWQAVLAPFINAYKNGAKSISAVTPFGEFAGAFWYRTLLASASCSGDSLGRPDGAENAQDLINIAVLLPANTSGVTMNVYSGGNLVATLPTTAGLNIAAVDIKTGSQKVDLVDSAGSIMGSGSSTVDVAADTSGVCNFNYQVIHIA
ncbi:glycoside hydrolase [Lentinus tigrinus ALCF2SS1-7]|uniref:Glycoside hydrolase n=1 Tax=Lentinus tigrinus ALCF2SS1-6 TaxID=1328759 RepID=A0A5C2SUP9_9APHY|nr:glycoside hydrolase [Lentinus tigrinus ALCF2SS1-6]RPD80973.1 glycoside hydrolase [Lentinus tigrinus ALCF2SS1-7]